MGGEPVGDGEHMWLVPTPFRARYRGAQKSQRTGILLLDSAGRLDQRASLPSIAVEDLKAVGDGKHGLVLPRGAPGAFLIDVSGPVDNAPNLLPSGYEAHNVHKTPDGLWIEASTDSFNQALFFLAKGSLRIEGPLKRQRLGGPVFTQRNLVTTLEFVTQGSVNDILALGPRLPRGYIPIVESVLNIEVSDRAAGTTTITMHLQQGNTTGNSYPNAVFSRDGRYCWVSPQLHKGLVRIDLQKLFASGKPDPRYQPPVYFADQFVDSRSATPEVAWVFPQLRGRFNENEYSRPAGASLIDLTDESAPKIESPEWLAKEIVHAVVPLDADSALIDVGNSDASRRVVYATRSGEHTMVGHSTLDRNVSFTSVATVFATPDGKHFLIDAYNGTFAFDRGQRKLIRLGDKLAGEYVRLPQDGHRRFWIVNFNRPFRGIVLYDLVAGILNRHQPLFADEPALPTLTPFDNGKTALAYSSDIGTMLVEAVHAPMPLGVTLANVHLGEAAPVEVAFDPNAKAPEAAAVLRNWPVAVNPETKIALRITCGDAELRMGSDAIATAEGNHALHVVSRRGLVPFGKSCNIMATISDAYGTKIDSMWSGITFVQPVPVIRRPWFHSILLFLGICVLAAAGASLRGGMQRWAPLGVYAIGGVAGMVLGSMKDLFDGSVLGALLAFGFIVTLLCGVVSPTVFRDLERIEPFRTLAPFALTIPRMRRQLYQAYAQRVSDDVAQLRKKTRGEVYSPIPVQRLDSRRIDNDSDFWTAESLLDALSGAHVLIESTGGRGKSALIRQIVMLALQKFACDPRRPLPVVCDGAESTLLERAKRSLGTDGFSDELTRALLKSGEFFLVVDGMTESGVTAAMLREHLATFGIACPLLLAGRPNASLRRAVETAQAWLVAEPSRLDDITLPQFVKTYGRDEKDFRGIISQLCRHRDGTYLPVLVRLALLPPPGQQVRSISELYSNAALELLRDDALFDSAVTLCLETYWKDGERQVTYAVADAQRKELLTKLLGSGLLFASDGSGSEEPRSVRFFHDTMQTFLTSVGLSRCDDWSNYLLRAAGDERFARDDSDLLIGAGSELFQMCIYVFDSPDRVHAILREGLLAISEKHGDSLSRDWVVSAGQLEDARIERRIAGGTALVQAIGHVSKKDDIRPLAALYAKVVHHLWEKLNQKSS